MLWRKKQGFSQVFPTSVEKNKKFYEDVDKSLPSVILSGAAVRRSRRIYAPLACVQVCQCEDPSTRFRSLRTTFRDISATFSPIPNSSLSALHPPLPQKRSPGEMTSFRGGCIQVQPAASSGMSSAAAASTGETSASPGMVSAGSVSSTGAEPSQVTGESVG